MKKQQSTGLAYLHLTQMTAIILLFEIPAAADVRVTDAEHSIFFGEQIEYIEDTNNLSITQIMNKKEGWGKCAQNNISFGFSPSVYWLRFTLDNEVSDEAYLTVNDINADRIDVYLQRKDGSLLHKTGGSIFPFSQREVRDKSLFFILPSQPLPTRLYVRLESHYTLTILPELVIPRHMSSRVISTYLPAVFSHGIFLALLIFHLFIYISSRDRSYLFLSLLIAAFQLYDLAHDGLGFMFVWPESVFFEQRVIPFSMGLMGASSAAFIMISLETKKNYRRTFWAMMFLVIWGVAECVSVFLLPRSFNMPIMLLYAVVGSLLAAVLLFYIGVIRRNRSAILMFVAYSLFETSNFVAIAATNPWLAERIPFLREAFLILIISKYVRVLFVMIFSLVVADRINFMKRELEISEETYRSIFNGTRASICILNAKTRAILDANQTMQETFQTDRESIIGKNLTRFSATRDGYDEEEAETLYREAIRKGSAQAEWIFAKNNADTFWADLMISSVMINGERTLMAAIQDISERKKAEDDKDKVMQQLTQAQKMEAVGSLAGGLAHDFNNILGGIVGSATLAEYQIEEQKLPPNQYLTSIQDLAMKASETVKRLLTITRKQELKFESADLNRLIENVVGVCENSFPKSVRIETHYLDGPAPIYADRSGLEQVFLNICVNASHALTIMRQEDEKEGGVVSLKIEPQLADRAFCRINQGAKSGARYYQVSIQDNGCGIDPDILERIFNPFFTTKKRGTGTGLGLSMVYTIVRQHNGFVRVYSEKGVGTTFIVLLPEDTELADTESTDEQTVIRGEGRILLIDDESYIRDSVSVILRNCGYEVVTAAGGEDGIEIYRKDPDAISLILLDMSMPELSGLETFKELRKIREDVKVVLSSGFSMDDRVQRAIGLGVSEFIQKPYTNIQLSQVIHRILTEQE